MTALKGEEMASRVEGDAWIRPGSLWLSLCLSMCTVVFCRAAQAADGPGAVELVRQRDVIYGRKHGMALTMDVLTPKHANGLGVLWVISSGGRSSVEQIDRPSFQKCARILLDRGYTVFAVVHSSAPRFPLQDMVSDVRRAVRFVRCHAGDFRIDADRLTIAGSSAGGSLALLMGMTAQAGDPNHADPVERVSSKVQAVGCFFGPSDWLDFDGQGTDVLAFQRARYGSVDPSFVFYDTAPEKQTRREITDTPQLQSLLKEYSPIHHVTADDAPTLIIHGDTDPFIPIQQSQRLIQKLEANNIPCQLVIRSGKGHGWNGWEADTTLVADWFDAHLRQSRDCPYRLRSAAPASSSVARPSRQGKCAPRGTRGGRSLPAGTQNATNALFRTSTASGLQPAACQSSAAPEASSTPRPLFVVTP